jgi:hypothetical protein
MRCFGKIAGLILLVIVVWACGGKDPQPALPGYLVDPSDLAGYQGSGLVTINGPGLTLRAEGPERIDASTQTYSGVLGNIVDEDIRIRFTLGQPRPYQENGQVPNQYLSYGNLTIRGTLQPGTYPMGGQSQPTPRGEITDLTLFLPGPQLYVNNTGSLTITESTRIRSAGGYSLYRVQGTFQANMYGTGVGISQREPTFTGTFDVLLVSL